MGKKTIDKNNIKNVLTIILICLLGMFGIVFSVLYFETFSDGIIKEYFYLIIAICIFIISFCTLISIYFLLKKNEIIYKIFFLIITFVSIIVFSLYILKIVGFFDKIKSVDDFRNYISSFGTFAPILFILIQFLQVVVLPIPAFITVGAGVLLFGPLKGAIYSCCGIIFGSIIAFMIGRIFGYKIAKWLVGAESLKKGLHLIKGKDKIVLTFMFLFPFFPDDILCFVAGITTISKTFFIVMIFITRIISIFCSSYSMNNSIIPYDTWWGILIWILFFSLTIFLAFFVYKKGDKIEKFFKRKNKKSG